MLEAILGKSAEHGKNRLYRSKNRFLEFNYLYLILYFELNFYEIVTKYKYIL